MDLSGYGLSPKREEHAELELGSDPAALRAAPALPPCPAQLSMCSSTLTGPDCVPANPHTPFAA